MSDNIEPTEAERTSKQVGEIVRAEGGRFAPGHAPNPAGVGGFQDRPEDRSNGSWNKAKTPRAKLEAMLEDMTVADIMIAKTELNNDSNVSAKIGDIAASGRLLNVFAITPEGTMSVNSKEFDSLMYMVYGSKSELDASLKAEEGTHIITGFVLPTAPQDFIDEHGNQKPQE